MKHNIAEQALVQSMAYRKPIIDRMDAQTAKGMVKYGNTIDRSGHLQDVEQTLEYLAEELTDGLVYIQHAKELLNQTKTVIVRIMKLHPNADIPQYARPLDAGFDLVAVEDVIVRPGESVKVKTGIALALPPGYEMQVRPRSGVSAKTKLRISNAPGTVDAGFRGEICVLIDNIAQMIPTGAIDGEILFGTTFMLLGLDGEPTDYVPKGMKENSYYNLTYVIKKGDRIAQGVLAEVPKAKFEVVDELDETDRGSRGFGSSGVTAL